jgi:hypothetical protein
MTQWEPQFVEPASPLMDTRHAQYREITIWQNRHDGRFYQFIGIERTPPGDFFIALCIAWKDSIFVRMQSEDVLSHVRHNLRQFSKQGGATFPTLEAAIAAYDLSQAVKG